MQEEWITFPNNPRYSVSNTGRVYNNHLDRERLPSIDKEGFKRITMYEAGTYTTYYVHRLVAYLFVPGFRQGHTIEFLNLDRSDCNVNNLSIKEPPSDRVRRIRETQGRIHANRVRVIELDKTFRNAYAAAHYINGDVTTIYKCLRGERRSHNGYTFEYQNTQQALAYIRGEAL